VVIGPVIWDFPAKLCPYDNVGCPISRAFCETWEINGCIRKKRQDWFAHISRKGAILAG
jgi:hypothetical protein